MLQMGFYYRCPTDALGVGGAYPERRIPSHRAAPQNRT